VKVPDDVETSIVDKATYVEDAVAVLAAKRSLDEAVYRGDREQQAIVEREFQTAIEACIDIAGLLIRASDGEMPETYGDRFDLLEELDVLTAETSERMREAAGFRNVLVHQYGNEIDDATVYEHLQTELAVLVEFLREIREVLKNEST